MSLYNIQQLSAVAINNQMVPDEGPKVIPLILDFTAADSYEIPLKQLTDSQQISMVQSIFLDTKDTDVQVVVTVEGSVGQQIKLAGRNQGYFSVLAPNPLVLVFSCPGGPIMKAFLINVPVAGHSWPTQ